MTAEAPTHVAAEVYIPAVGWIPTYPNLGGGRYDLDYGLGRTGGTIVLVKREGSWVWSNWLPPDAYTDSDHKPILKVEMRWDLDIVDGGKAYELYDRHR